MTVPVLCLPAPKDGLATSVLPVPPMEAFPVILTVSVAIIALFLTYHPWYSIKTKQYLTDAWFEIKHVR
jgi:hypothetical protein